ncbi:hypothetical protein J6590_043020 [Homalodisca vitripennis]|nr:hypothetical protein J6590_043020 [Homalodisca vitripennis]
MYVNISSVWLLPEEGFPVFYRYFRDRITWFEADAVCQFHHANLVTVDSSEQYDATRAYLKELDVVNNVWVGLKRSGSEGEFTWTDYKPLENGGYWQEQIPMTDNPVCAALDPAADFRWHPLNCGGPEVASFICQLEVPAWARKEDGCMLTSLPSLTVTYLPEQGAVELISDCGLEGTRRIACKGQANRDEMMKQLSCESSTEGQTEATSSNTWDNDLPTRHRRDTDVTVDMASAQHLVPTTEGTFSFLYNTCTRLLQDDLPIRHQQDTDVTVDMASAQHLVPTTEGTFSFLYNTCTRLLQDDLPIRHQRDTDVTVDMASAQHLVPTTEGTFNFLYNTSTRLLQDDLPIRHRRDTDVTVDMASAQHLPITPRGLSVCLYHTCCMVNAAQFMYGMCCSMPHVAGPAIVQSLGAGLNITCHLLCNGAVSSSVQIN